MAGFDRSKLKATSLATLQAQEGDVSSKRPSGGKSFDRNFLSIDDGPNKFRIFPFHPEGGGESYAEAKCVTFLEVKVPKRGDDKKVIEGEFEIKRKPVFNSKVHGNLPKDLVEEYLEFMKKTALPNAYGDDQAAFTQAWRKITDGRFGVKPVDSWVVYAAKFDFDRKTKTFLDTYKIGQLEFKKSVKTQLTELAASGSDSVQSPDPYSDADEGFAIIIEKSGQNLDTKYSVDIESVRNGKTIELISTPLTDAMLEEWSKLDSLHKMFVGSFTRKDFDMQLEGIQRFDVKLSKELGIDGAFVYDDFLDTVEEISNMVPENNEVKEEKKDVAPPAPSTPKPMVRKTVAQKPIEVIEDNGEEEMEVDNSSSVPVVNDRLAAIKAKLGKK